MDFLNLDCPTNILFGGSDVPAVGDAVADWGCQRAMIVSDPGIVALGYPDTASHLLNTQGIETTVYTGIHENPSSEDVVTGVQAALQFQPDLLIGLGGGSSMDCAKGMNFVYTNGVLSRIIGVSVKPPKKCSPWSRFQPQPVQVVRLSHLL